MASEASTVSLPVGVLDDPEDPSEDGGPPPDRAGLFERIFLRRLRRGDQRAFADLVKQHQDRVYSLCLRMLGDAAEAEDLSQEVFLAVHRHLPRFRGECRLSTWIFRVTRNHCLNRIKSAERRGATERAAQVDTEPVLSEGAPEPDKALLGAEERRRVQAALARLSAEHRLLVVLRDIEGLSYEDVARIAELPAGTVKSRLHRARSALARLLAAEGMAPDGAVAGGRS